MTARILTDIIGLIGVAMIIIAYLLLQLNKVKGHSLNYLLLNLIGSSLLLISIFGDWNLAAFVIQVCWIVISIIGLIKRRSEQNN